MWIRLWRSYMFPLANQVSLGGAGAAGPGRDGEDPCRCRVGCWAGCQGSRVGGSTVCKHHSHELLHPLPVMFGAIRISWDRHAHTIGETTGTSVSLLTGKCSWQLHHDTPCQDTWHDGGEMVPDATRGATITMPLVANSINQQCSRCLVLFVSSTSVRCVVGPFVVCQCQCLLSNKASSGAGGDGCDDKKKGGDSDEHGGAGGDDGEGSDEPDSGEEDSDPTGMSEGMPMARPP